MYSLILNLLKEKLSNTQREYIHILCSLLASYIYILSYYVNNILLSSLKIKNNNLILKKLP